MRNVLDQIVLHKRQEVRTAQERISLAEMARLAKADTREPLLMTSYITDKKLTGIIAEYKRKSPSKGIINDSIEVEDMAAIYKDSGASALSILTDKEFFGGSNEYLQRARRAIDLPILRKDFVVSPYQVYEAKVIGADTILLIGECLDRNEISELLALSHDLGMQVLIEIHSESQLGKVPKEVDMVGVNNRDLTTFVVDYERSIQLIPKLPTEAIKIAESGLSQPQELAYLYGAGFDGFLIGETFMRSAIPSKTVAPFMNEYMQLRAQL